MNQTIKAILVDDESHALENLTLLLQNSFSEIEILASSDNALDAVKQINKHRPDVVFLDISMPTGTGFDILEAVGTIDFNVVFITAHKEYAIEAIRHNAFDYILKPIQLDLLKTCIENLKQNLASTAATQSNTSTVKLCVYTLDSIEFIAINSIIYCKSEGSYTYIYLNDGKEILSSKPLKDIQAQLGLNSFIRCHKSYLVNTEYIVKYYRPDECLILTNEVSIPLARSQKRVVLSKLITLSKD